MSEPQLTAESINKYLIDEFAATRSRCIELGEDFAIAEMVVEQDALRPGGFVPGPTQFALIDAAFWYATFVSVDRIEPMALTSELSIRYLRPAQGEVIRCRAVIEAAGRRNVVLSGRVWVDDREHKPTATAQGTYALPFAR